MKLLRSLPSALPSASAIGHRMGSTLGALPRPSVDLHLAAQALRSVKRGVRSAARGVAGVFAVAPQPAPTRTVTAMQSLRALALLGQHVPTIPELPTALTIENAQTLADNLQAAGDDRLVALGQSIDNVMEQALQLAKTLNPMVGQEELPAKDVRAVADQVARLQKAALATQTKARETCFGFSTHLQQWMDQLVELSTATQARVTTGATLVRFNDLTLESTSEPANPLDFAEIDRFMTSENAVLLKSFEKAFNQQAGIVALQTALDDQPVESQAWCHALGATFKALSNIHDLVEKLSNYCVSTGGQDGELVDWLKQKQASLALETDKLWTQIEMNEDAMHRAGFDF